MTSACEKGLNITCHFTIKFMQMLNVDEFSIGVQTLIIPLNWLSNGYVLLWCIMFRIIIDSHRLVLINYLADDNQDYN